MIRHYERLGLLPPAARTEAGYRRYQERDIHSLRFIRNARDLGFSIADIQRLLALWHDQQRPSAEVKALAQKHIAELEGKIGQLQAMKSTLERLDRHCQGDERPDCPILSGLADTQRPSPCGE